MAEGTTLLLTTRYLEEADQLGSRIAVIDRGRVVAEGAPHELKDSAGGAQLTVILAAGSGLRAAIGACGRSLAGTFSPSRTGAGSRSR